MTTTSTHNNTKAGYRDGGNRRQGAKPDGLGARAKAAATAAALAGRSVGLICVCATMSTCAGLNEFASQYEREVRLEYRTDQGSATYVIRRPANARVSDGKAVVK